MGEAVMRAATRGLERYIATVETSRHRVFCFLPTETLPDNMLTALPVPALLNDRQAACELDRELGKLYIASM